MCIRDRDVSDYHIAKNAWMEAGSSEDEAEKQALKELIVRVAMALSLIHI